MRFIRRTLQIVALVGTLLIGILAIALIVSQTPWFKGWLRRYIVREAGQYLNGELYIGGLAGNLFFGVELTDVSLLMGGHEVIRIKDAGVDYSVFEIVSRGVVLSDLRLNQPTVRLERTGQGWNLARLVKRQERENERRGPARPISIGEIGISDGTVTIEGARSAGGMTLPQRIDRLNASFGFVYEPVEYTIDLAHVSFRAGAPELDLNALSGRIDGIEDGVRLRNVTVRTAQSSLRVDGTIRRPDGRRVVDLTVSSDKLSLQEFSRVFPVLSGYEIEPALEVAARGPIDRLALDLNLRSGAGNVAGSIVTDLTAPHRTIVGALRMQRLDLAVFLKNQRLQSDITGLADVNLTFGTSFPRDLGGRYRFRGTQATFMGYAAEAIDVTGRINGRHVSVAGNARGYGSNVTTTGTVSMPAGGDPVRYELQGRAARVDLRRIPPQLPIADFASDLTLDYRVRGAGTKFTGDARLYRSTIEGATVADGTTGSFSNVDRVIAYSAAGVIEKLDLQRIGRVLGIKALMGDRYRSSLDGPFQVTGRGSALADLDLHGRGTVTESTILGGRLPNMELETRIADSRLTVDARGAFAGFDPAVLTGRPNLEGDVTGTADIDIAIPDLGSDIKLDEVEARGRVALRDSRLGEVRIDAATIDADYQGRVGQIRELHASGPDLALEASGVLGLDDAHQSDLAYTLTATRLEEVGRLLDRPLSGRASVEGKATGNAGELRSTGTLKASSLRYGADLSALEATTRFDIRVPDLEPRRTVAEAETEATFVQIRGQEIDQIAAKTTYVDQKLGFSGTAIERQRRLDAAGSLVLHSDHHEIHLQDLALRTEGVEWRVAAGAEPAIQYGGDALTFTDVRLVNGEQRIDVAGSIGLGEGGTGQLRIDATDVDLAQVSTLLPDERSFAGRLRASAVVKGSTAAPIVDGRLEVTNGRVERYGFERLEATVDYTSAGIALDARLQQTPEQWLTAKGTLPRGFFERSADEHVPAGSADSIDVAIETSAVDLGVIQGLTTAVSEVTGSLQANVRVTGSGRDPHLTGYVDVRGGNFLVPALGTRYTGLDTRIDLQPDRAAINGFTIRDDEGNPLNVSGGLAVHERQIGEVQIKLASANFEMMDNEYGNVGMSVDLNLTGSLRRPRVTGNVEVNTGRVEVDRVLAALISEPYAVPAIVAEPQPGTAVALRPAAATVSQPGVIVPTAAEAAPEAPVQGLADAIAVDVQFRIPGNLILRGSDLRPRDAPIGLGNVNVTVGGEVRVQKPAGRDAIVLGRVETVRGSYEFQGRRFDVERGGRISFEGLERIDPSIDITAQRIISGIETRVHLTGTARTPELDLSSRPPLDEADILALILFNQPINTLGAGQRMSLAERAGELAAGFVVSPIVGSVAKALNIDLLEVQGPVDGSGASVTLGEQVSERLYVRFRQSFGAEDVSEFLLEYRIADFLRLQTSIAEGDRVTRSLTQRVERGGIDLIFFFSY